MTEDHGSRKDRRRMQRPIRGLLIMFVTMALLAVVASCGNSSKGSDTQVMKGGVGAPAIQGGASGLTPSNAPMKPDLRKINTVPNVAPPREHKTETVIAFGDSYGSGEGNPLTSIDPNKFSSQLWNIITDATFILSPPLLLKIVVVEVAAALIRLALLRKGSSKIADPYWMFPQDHAVWSKAAAGSPQAIDDNRCHRSDQSGVAKAAAIRAGAIGGSNVTLKSFACSGAISDNISANANVNAMPHYVPYDGVEDGVLDGLPWLPSQIDQAKSWLKDSGTQAENVDAVYVSIGGNDAKFADVVSACFVANMPFIKQIIWGISSIASWFTGSKVPNDCTQSDGYKNGLAAMRDIPTRISNLSLEIRATFPNAVIMFSGYPDPISVGQGDPGDRNNDGVCSSEDWTPNVRNSIDAMWAVNAGEARKIRDGFLAPLNSSIENGVKNARLPMPMVTPLTPSGLPDTKVVYLGDHTRTATAGFHGFCSQAPQIQFNTDAMKKQLCFGGPLCLVSLGISPGAWHPNDLGYQLYAKSISDVLARVDNWEFDTPVGAPKPPEFVQALSISSDGNYTINWSDASDNEDFYEVTTAPLDATGKVGATSTPQRIPTGTQQFTLSNAGRDNAFRFSVRACNTRNKAKALQCSTNVSVDLSDNVPNPAGAPSEVTNCGLSFELESSSCDGTYTLPPNTPTTASNFLVVTTRVNTNPPKVVAVPITPGRVSLGFTWRDASGALLPTDKDATATVQIQFCTIVDGGKCTTPSPVHTMTGKLSMPRDSRPFTSTPQNNYTLPSIPQGANTLPTPSVPTTPGGITGPSMPGVTTPSMPGVTTPSIPGLPGGSGAGGPVN